MEACATAGKVVQRGNRNRQRGEEKGGKGRVRYRGLGDVKSTMGIEALRVEDWC